MHPPPNDDGEDIVEEENTKHDASHSAASQPTDIVPRTLHELFKTLPEYFYYSVPNGGYQVFWNDLLFREQHDEDSYKEEEPEDKENNRQNYLWLKDTLAAELEDMCVVRYTNFDSEEVSFYFLMGRKGSYLAGFWWIVERDS